MKHMANTWRGETPILLDGIEYVLRPSFRVLYDIERRLSTSITVLAQRFSDGQLTLKEMVVIIHCCMQQRASERFLECVLERNGLDNVTAALGALFTQIFGGMKDE